MRARKGIVRGAFSLAVVCALSIATAVGALAHQPGPTGTTQDNWVFLNLRGYLSPPANYTVGQTFSFSFDVSNEAATPRELCLSLEVYRLDLNPNTSYTEAQLENMVHTSNIGQTLVTTATLTQTFAAHQLITGLTMSATITAAGYYQFDTGLCGTGPFSPGTGHTVPPVSGFVRYLPTGGVSGTGTSPTPTPTTTTSGSVSAANTTHLASTGGGISTLAWSGAPLALIGLALFGLGLLLRRGAKRPS